MTENPPLAKDTKEKIRSAWERPSDILVVHYSCSLFQDVDRERPAVWLIAVKQVEPNQEFIFGEKPGDERKTLDEFSDFVRGNSRKTWIHFNMRGEPFGFEAIARRHRFIGGEPTIPPVENRLDLKAAIRAIHGHDFADHPRLPSLMKINELTCYEMLTHEESQEAFRAGRFESLRLSTMRKVHAIWTLFTLLEQGRLKTKMTCGTEGPAPRDAFNWRGKRCELPPNAFKLVEYLWGCQGHTAQDLDIALACWGDEEKAEITLPNAYKAANARFDASNLAANISKRGVFYTLELLES